MALVKALNSLSYDDWSQDSRSYIHTVKKRQRGARCLSFGLTSSKCLAAPNIAKATHRFPEIFALLKQIGKVWPDEDLKWSSIHVLCDFITTTHVDKLNVEAALHATFGDYAGSHLGVERTNGTTDYDTKNKLMLASVKEPHFTQEFQLRGAGHRYSCVWFTKRDYFSLAKNDPTKLRLLDSGVEPWGDLDDF